MRDPVGSTTSSLSSPGFLKGPERSLVVSGGLMLAGPAPETKLARTIIPTSIPGLSHATG